MMFKWTCEIEVDESWVADGFDLTAERLHSMVNNDIAYAYPEEIKCRIVKAPDPKSIRKVQGYEDGTREVDRQADVSGVRQVNQ